MKVERAFPESLAAWFAEHERPARRNEYDSMVSEFAFDTPVYCNAQVTVFSLQGAEELFGMPLCVSLPRQGGLDRTYAHDAAILELMAAENPKWEVRSMLPRFMGCLLLDGCSVGRVFEDMTDHGRLSKKPAEERTDAQGMLSLYMCSHATRTHMVAGQEKWLGVYAGNFPADPSVQKRAEEYKRFVYEQLPHTKLYVHAGTNFADLIERAQRAV